MIDFKEILYTVSINAVVGSTNVYVRNIEFDSRKIAINDVFVAIKGSHFDGHDFIKAAIQQQDTQILDKKCIYRHTQKMAKY